MREEEKKAIEYWKRDISLYHYNTQLCSEHYAQIILNLIETQQKELREMRKAIDTKNAEIECLNVIHESYKEMVAENNYISKDKIKAKIEEINKEMLNEENSLELFYRKKYCKEALQSLLEEE